MKKTLFSIFSIFFFDACQESIMKEERMVINENNVTIKYLNFIPHEMDTSCMQKSITELFDAIEKNAMTQYKSMYFIEHKYFKKLIATEGLNIENLNKDLFIIFSLEKSLFFLSKKTFTDKNLDNFSMYQLKSKIDFKKCWKI